MITDGWIQKRDLYHYKRILDMKSDEVKDFFNRDGCGLEIEFGVVYERRCRTYIKTGLQKMKALVGSYGKFVPDMSVGNDLNVEIVLVPLLKEPLKHLFLEIKNIIDFYENFVFDQNCGVHANFLADRKLKQSFFRVLANGGYDSSRFIHSKYKMDFMNIVRKSNAELMSYEEYLRFQDRVSAKYAGVNFMKENLVEFRTLDLNWNDIAYVYDLYEWAKQTCEPDTIELYPLEEAAQNF